MDKPIDINLIGALQICYILISDTEMLDLRIFGVAPPSSGFRSTQPTMLSVDSPLYLLQSKSIVIA